MLYKYILIIHMICKHILNKTFLNEPKLFYLFFFFLHIVK